MCSIRRKKPLTKVSSHSKVLGNEKADARAKDVARRGGRATDYWSSLTHIKSELRDAELLRWHQSEESRKGSYNARGFTQRQNELGNFQLM